MSWVTGKAVPNCCALMLARAGWVAAEHIFHQFSFLVTFPAHHTVHLNSDLMQVLSRLTVSSTGSCYQPRVLPTAVGFVRVSVFVAVTGVSICFAALSADSFYR